jgi:LacI family transcriptional regulator
MVENSHFPAVLINKKQEINCVYPDEVAAGRQAAEHMMSLGHRRIGFISPPPLPNVSPHFSAIDRREGCHEALVAAGLTPHHIHTLQNSTALLRASIRAALLGEQTFQNGPVTGFITSSRTCAEMLLIEALFLGREPGRDFSLITIDVGAEPCGHIQIDFLRTPSYWIGRETGQFAIDLLNSGKTSLPSRSIPYRDYIEGDTCAPPPVS